MTRIARRTTVRVERACKEDQDDMIDVLIAAFAPSLANRLIEPDVSKWRPAYKKGFAELWDTPHVRMYKAVDSVSNKILGAAAWVAFDGTEYSAAKSEDWLFQNSLAHAPHLREAITKGHSKRDDLLKRMRASLQDAKKRWIVGKPCQFLAIVGVEPDCQGHGIGESLIQVGMDEANQRQVFCYLESSPAGYPVYKKMGWNRVDDELAIDLSEYGGKDRGYGITVTRLMVRMPDAKS